MAIKILCVDDEPKMELLYKQKFRKKIRQKEYEMFFATDGQKALEILNEHHDISIILSDIAMPNMDGLQLLEVIGDLNVPHIKVIIISAFGDMNNIRAAMNRGAFDFLNKPLDFDDLDKTLTKTIQAVENAKEGNLAKKELSTIKEDLNVAQQIQLSLVPKVFPPFPERTDFEIHGKMDAAKNIGGDLFDFFFIDKHRLGVVIGDVAGKGIPAALFMALSRTIIRVVARRGIFPDVCMAQANDLLSKESVDAMFVTVFYGIFDTRTGDFMYSNAGHNPPYIIRNSGKVEKLQPTNDPMLGVMEDIEFHTKSVTLHKNEVLFMYTDGITEALDEQNNEFQEERLEHVLKENKNLTLNNLHDTIIAQVKNFSGNAEQSDDITMLSLRYL